MKETGILFSAPMVRAILAGEKTQTRRLLKPQPPEDDTPLACEWFTPSVIGTYGEEWSLKCPYGAPGDRLILLSSWAVAPEYDAVKPTELPSATSVWSRWDGGEKPEWCGKLRPGRFLPTSMRHLMPRAEVVGVRVERVQDISEADAVAEGVAPLPLQRGEPGCWWTADPSAGSRLHANTPRAAFCRLWRSINGVESWDANPWVWVIEFKRVAA